MNDNTQKFTALTGTLLLIIASIFYAVRSNTAIQSSRPQQAGLQSYTPPGHQNKQERLWQDPFDAFAPASNQVASEAVFHPDLIPTNLKLAVSTSTDGGTNYYAFGAVSNSAAKEKKEINDLCDSVQQDTSRMHVFAVMLPGTQLAEGVEARRKTRYAVETALLSSDLAPDDSDHIGASMLQLTNYSGPNGQTNLQVAFEWFNSKNPDTDRFLVLWLREDDFYADALETLYNVLSFVTTNHSKSEAKFIDLKLIGPVSSDMLKILGSGELPANCPDKSLWTNFAIYSPEATAPEINLWHETSENAAMPEDRPITQRKITNALHCTTVRLKNWVATDDQLCKKLVGELSNRGDGTVLNSNHVVVLVSEADTAFGRSLPLTFRNELSGASPQIWNFEYLQGLDGSKPATKHEERPAASSSTDPQALIESALRTPDERAENDAQLDYAERLGELLADKERELRRRNGDIVAVGLFGTDVYDKLILLQALRPRLKEALFFTTDLDARMWMPSKLTGITRNLIVASSYSLEPKMENNLVNGTHLPFRDVYQTAEFLATRGAVFDSLHPTNLMRPELAGQLFEIGRHGPVELKSGPDSRPWLIQMLLNPRTSIMLWLFRIAFVGLVVALLWLIGWSNVGIIFKDNLLPWVRKRTLLVCGIVIAVILAVCLTKFGLHHHPHVSRKILAWCIAGFGVPVLAIILCGGFHREERTLVDDQTQISLSPRTPACHGAKEDPHTEDTLPPFGLLAYLAIAVLFCVLFSVLPYMISSWPGEESSGWSDGVSIWPTEIIRFFVVVLSVGYFAGAHRRNSRHYRTLWWDYMREGNYKQVRADIKKSRTNDKGWMRIRNVLVANWSTPRDGSKVDARMLLAGYLKRAHARNRYLRALPLAALYLVLGFTCVQLLNGMPNRICVRGSWSWLIDNVMLMLSVMSFLVALFLSLDGARLTARLLDGIGSRPTSWPQQLLDEWSSKCGVRCSDLDGYLDVRFAVDKTRESRVLMFFPFVIFLLLLISREHFIENWTWTPELAAVFAFNFLLAGMCWWIVRRSATKIREEALQKLGDAIKHVNGTPNEDIIFTCPTSPVEDEDGSPPATTTFTYSPKDYAERLTALRKEIEDERRGAFALWIQDPTYLALFLPTGVTGIVAFLLQYWLPHS